MQEDSYDCLVHDGPEDSGVFDFNYCPDDCAVDDISGPNDVHDVHDKNISGDHDCPDDCVVHCDHNTLKIEF